MIKNPKVLSWSLLILLSLIWGSSFILIKKGLLGLNAIEVGAIRIISASIFLLPIAIRHLYSVKRKFLPLLLVIGMVGSFVPAFLFAIAQTNLESSITGVLNALTPLFVILTGFVFFSQTFGAKKISGMFLGFIGSACLVLAGSEFSGSDINYYAFYVILATIMYGVNLNVIKYYLKEVNSLAITSISLMFVGPFAVAILFFFTDYFSNVFVVQEVAFSTLYILLLGVVGTAIALIIFNYLVKITDPVFTSSVTYIIPIVAVIWGLIDREILHPMDYFGIALILAGVWVANSKPKEKTARKNLQAT